MHESVTNLLEEAEKIPHVTPGSLRSAGEFYIPTSPRPTHWYGWVAIPRLASLGWGYLHLCRDAHDLSEAGDMYTTYIILRARATHLLRMPLHDYFNLTEKASERPEASRQRCT